jgi:hypothetical protein
MIPQLTPFTRNPLLARALIGAAGGAALLSLALAAPGRGHRARRLIAAVPPVVQPQPESRPVAGPLTLTSLMVGEAPGVYAAGRRVVRTFVTDDAETCHVVATARRVGASSSGSIQWTIAAPTGFVVPVEGSWSGPRLDVVLRRPGGNPSGLGGPLTLTLQARTEQDGQEYTARETIVQDEIDQLRQEYIDLDRRAVPDRAEFLDAATFASRFGHAYPWLHFEDLNWSVNPTTRLRFAYAIIRPELVQGLDHVRRAYGSVVINSGYRNPVRQVEVHAPAPESLHQYGYAADLAVTPAGGRPLPNEVDWRRLAEVACGAAAKWVEPLAASAPNSPGCHVHLDYRPGPVSSAPVHLRGQVVSAATGKPVAGALVLLGAMPARTDANGFFGIRNVLSGGLHPVEVRAAGYEPLIEPVRLVAWGSATARLAVREPVQNPVLVTVARSDWTDARARLLDVTLRLSNRAGSAVDDVRLSVSVSGGAVIQPAPTFLSSLPAGAVRGVRLVVRPVRPGVADPIRLGAEVTLRRAGAAEEATRIVLPVTPPARTAAGGAALARKPAPPSLPKAAARSRPDAVAPSAPKPASRTVAPTPPASTRITPRAESSATSAEPAKSEAGGVQPATDQRPPAPPAATPLSPASGGTADTPAGDPKPPAVPPALEPTKSPGDGAKAGSPPGK